MSILESLGDLISGGAITRARETASYEARGAAHFQERALDLEAAVRVNAGETRNWQVLSGGTAAMDVSAQSLKDLRTLARFLYLKNPLINRGVQVQADYVFGLGCTVRCEDDKANGALEAFWNDNGNRAALTEPYALVGREITQQIDGETFFAFFTNRITGHVRIRTVEADEVQEVITNPDDRYEPWYYKRTWTAPKLDLATGRTVYESRTAYYPDWRYNPAKKPQTIGGHSIEWNTPVYHVKTGGMPGMTRGMSELLCQLDWAQAYTNFLENRATVAKALSRFVLQVQAATKKMASAVRTAMSGPTPGDIARDARGDARTAEMAITGEGQKIEAVSIKGATINPDEGRRFLLMVAAGSGLPETFYGDASVGSLATAESLDRPTELMMEKRRLLWQGVLTNIATYVLLSAIRAPLNPFKGGLNFVAGTPHITLQGGGEVEILVEFPPLLEHNVSQRVTAITDASQNLPLPRVIGALLLSALGVKDADKYLDKLPEIKAEPEPIPLPTDAKAPGNTKPPIGKAARSAQAKEAAEIALQVLAVEKSDVIEAFRAAEPELRELMAALHAENEAENE